MSGSTGAVARRASPILGWALAAALAIAVVMLAGYQGYLAGSLPATDSRPEPAQRPGLPGATSLDTGRSQLDGSGVSAAASRSPRSGGGDKRLSWPLWEFQLRQPIPPRDPSLTPPTWRMIGATQSAGVWSIVILRQGKTAPEYFRVGDQLPGGYRIEAITEEDVTLVQDGRALILSYIGSR